MKLCTDDELKIVPLTPLLESSWMRSVVAGLFYKTTNSKCFMLFATFA